MRIIDQATLIRYLSVLDNGVNIWTTNFDELVEAGINLPLRRAGMGCNILACCGVIFMPGKSRRV